MSEMRDVAIVGGGIAGLSFACALRTLAPGLSASVIDAPAPGGDERWSAITASGRRLFEATGAWAGLGPQAEPVRRMIVGVAGAEETVKPSDLTIEGEVAPGEPFAQMVSNTALVAALGDRAEALGVARIAAKVERLELDGAAARLRLTSGDTVAARLVVAADGGRSAVRRLAEFRTVAWDYNQAAVVATVAAELPHDGTAVQVFLPHGPIAALPIPGGRFSIVWTTSPREAKWAAGLDDTSLGEALNERLGWRFGKLTVVGARGSYPLRLEVARDLVKPRVALLGDAAHAIHPLAGQGLNLGFKDAAVLAEVLRDAAELGLDPGSEAVLDPYEQQRRFDTVAMSAVTDGFSRVSSRGRGPVRALMGFGMQLVDRLGPLKQRIMREAAGVEGELPLLLRERSAGSLH